jgi:hypothetical protein
MLTLATKAAQAAAVQVVTVGAAQVVAVATAVARKALSADGDLSVLAVCHHVPCTP